MRRRSGSIVANPVLVGAVAVLVVVVAVFLAYNANSGLPFVPSYQVTVVVPDASKLRDGNDVRVGGSRVGVISGITAHYRGGTATAELAIKIDKSLDPLPVDTQVRIRQQSNIGLQYLELTPGRSSRTVPDGGKIPASQTTPVVDLDDALSAFDEPTRVSLQNVLANVGTGLASRGPDLAQGFEDLAPVLQDLRTVTATLNSGPARLPQFLHGAESAARAFAPVTPQLAGLLDAVATTFAAFARERPSLDRTLAEAPATVTAATTAFVELRPLLRQTRTFLTTARPGIRELRTAAPVIAGALQTFGPALARTRGPLVAQLADTLRPVRALARRPSLAATLRRSTNALVPLRSALQTITPFQTKCNYLGLWGANVPSVISEGNSIGAWFRFLPIVKLDEELQSPTPAPGLHTTGAADTGAGGQCEIGNQGYAPGQQLDTVPGVQPLFTKDTRPPKPGTKP